MKVLVANANPIERKRIAGVLNGTGYEVLEAATAALAGKALDEHRPDAAVIEWPLAAGLAAALRARGKPYLVMTHTQWAPGDIAAAYAMGADDFLKTPACKEEVLGRVDGLKRARARLHEAHAKNHDFTAAFDLMQVRAWREIEPIVARDLGDLFGAELVPAPFASYTVARASEISLALSTDRIEVRLGIGADTATCAAIADVLLGGDTRTEALSDALRELANTAGGAVKRAAMSDGVTFTLGLPSDRNPFLTTTGHTHRWLARTESGLCLAFLASIAVVAPKVVQASQLREGMVIARDVLNAAGLLLASTGTYLTRSAAERLAHLAGAHTLVDITEMGGTVAAAAS